MRKSSYFFICLAIGSLLLTAAFIHALYQRDWRASELEENRNLARMLELTDLCLFTEARYTRQPALADFYAPFQEHPCSLEHFPSGSLIMPHRGKTKNHARLD